MDIKEAMGYVQAVADNCNDAPRYQRALQTVLDYVEASYDEQNRLLGEIAAQHEMISGLSSEISKRNDMIEAMRDELDVSRKKCQRLLEPIVWCKDCDRRAKSADLTDTVYCPWLKQQMRKTDFCSYGERRVNGG